MRFQCRIGDGAVMAPPPPLPRAPRTTRPPAPQAAQPRQGHSDKRRHKLARGAIAGAALLAVVGCTTLAPGSAKQWKVEPVFNVTHSAQSSQAYFALGQYFDGSMAWDKAIDAYRKAIAADAKNIAAYDALGVALAQAGRLADAEITLRQAVALAPDRPRIRNNLGYVLLLSGKPAEAVVMLKSVVDQDGGNAIATANLNHAMAQSGAVAGAVADTAAGTATAAVAVAVAVEAAAQPPAPAPVQAGAATAPLNLRVGYEPTVAALEERVARVAVPDLPAAPTAPAAPSAPAVAAVPHSAPHASRLEISNGNGVTGMAARVGRWLEAQGAPAERLTNRQPFTQRSTVVQYRPGQQDAAQHVARLLPADAKAESRPTSGLRSDVRVLLGRDWVQVATCLERNTCRPTSASASVAMAETKP